MIFHQYIETRTGEIWIVDASDNGFEKFHNESRQVFEARVINQIIASTIGEFELSHTGNGAPFIVNRPDLHVSISHSDNWFALFVSKHESVGIDIEVNSNLLLKAKNHFLTKSELGRFEPNEEELQICWGIKETVFKLLHGNLQSLKDEVEITSIHENKACAAFQNRQIEARFQQSETFTLVYSD